MGKYCPGGPGVPPCRVLAQHERERQERFNARQGRACEVCGEPVPVERPGNARRCGSPRCTAKAQYRAIKGDPERLERHRERTRAAVAKRRKLAEDVYGGRCVVCGKTELLHLDHLNSDGQEHRQVESSGSMVLRIAQTGQRLDDYALQLLCQRHHRLKTGAERGASVRVASVAELHKVLETALTFSGGQGVVLRPRSVLERLYELFVAQAVGAGEVTG